MERRAGAKLALGDTCQGKNLVPCFGSWAGRALWSLAHDGGHLSAVPWLSGQGKVGAMWELLECGDWLPLLLF